MTDMLKKLNWQFWFAIIAGVSSTLGMFYKLENKVDVNQAVQTARWEYVGQKMDASERKMDVMTKKVDTLIFQGHEITKRKRNEDNTSL